MASPSPSPSSSSDGELARLHAQLADAWAAHEGAPLLVLSEVARESPLLALALVLALGAAVYLAGSALAAAALCAARCVLRRLWDLLCGCCGCCGGGSSGADKAKKQRAADAPAAAPPEGDASCCGCCAQRCCCCVAPLLCPRRAAPGCGGAVARALSLALLLAAGAALLAACRRMDARLDALPADARGWQFSRAELAAAANEARLAAGAGASPSAVLGNVTALLEARYPGVITDCGEWIFIRSGGWLGAFRLLYASTSEYVLLFGTGVDTSGHSGRYYATIEDTLLTGTFLQWSENSVEPVSYKPGDTIIHERFAATGVQWTSGTWMLEHGLGFIPTTLPFAMGDTLLSAQDFHAAFRMLVVYAKLVTASALAGRF